MSKETVSVLLLGLATGALAGGSARWLVAGSGERSGGFEAGESVETVDPGPRAADRRPYLKEGWRLLSLERQREAFEQFARAARAAPEDPRPHYGMAEVYRAVDRNELAEAQYRECLRLDPSYLEAEVRLIKVLTELGKNREALRLLAEARRAKPNDFLLWAETARNHSRLGEPARAIPWLERCVRARPRDPWSLSNLGRALAEAGRTGEAERALRAAVTAEPRVILGWLWLGQLLVSRGRKDEAAPCLARFRQQRAHQFEARILERDLVRHPDDVDKLVRLARARFHLGKYEEALVPLERAVELRPADTRLQSLREGVRSELEKLEKERARR